MSGPEIQITRANRKSLSMRFDTQGVLQVRAPRFLLPAQIQSFLAKNAAWIEREYAKVVSKRNTPKAYYLFGKEIPPAHIHSLPSLLRGDGGRIERKQIEDFYKAEARAYIILRVAELAEEHGFTYNSVRITSAITRWGSCSSKKNLNFSYRLMMAPAECIDYVIIHELCHLRQMNHGSKFWAEVRAIMPEYKQYEKHLKENSYKYKI